MIITEIIIPIIEPMEAGDKIFFEKGSGSGAASDASYYPIIESIYPYYLPSSTAILPISMKTWYILWFPYGQAQ